MNIRIAESWKRVLSEEFDKKYFAELINFVKSEYSSQTIFPPGPQIFRAFDECSFEDLKVVILGQDPYHTPGVANGLAFSARDGQKVPPSLQNIYKELNGDLGIEIPKSPDLTRWAKQGVLLLNATLTVKSGVAGSHQKKGWETFTDSVIKLISDKKENTVFILWGAFAQKRAEQINSSKHFVIKSAHPSPLSAHNGFFGSKPFSKTNEYLRTHNEKEISW